MKMLISMLVVLLFSGCAGYQQAVQRNQSEVAELQDELDNAILSASLDCTSKQSCEKAFSLAKIYVLDHADMKIQLSDDTMVSTYNPIDYGRVALSATKIPGTGESSTIKLVASCKGMDDKNYFFKICGKRIAHIYRGFKPYIESKLK